MLSHPAFPVLALLLTSHAALASHIVFHLPHARWTSPACINNSGQIAGTYQPKKDFLGFVRAPDGTLTSFRIDNVRQLEELSMQAMNTAGTIVGYYNVLGVALHGFLLTASGTVTSFDAPGANPNYPATYPGGINDKGDVAGYYDDVNNSMHGFLRHSDGALVEIDGPGAGTLQNQGTVLRAINDSGRVAGYVIDSSNVGHGLVRLASGAETTFDVPGATGTYPLAINQSGVVVGNYLSDGNQSQYHAFVRDETGAITTFDVLGFGTEVFSVNHRGESAGTYTDAAGLSYAFVRSPSGAFRTLPAQGFTNCEAAAINRLGDVVGSCQNQKGTPVGVLWTH